MARPAGFPTARVRRLLITFFPLVGITIAANAQANRPARAPVAATAVAQKWEYQQTFVCQTPEVAAGEVPNLLLARLQSLGNQGFELVNVMSYPLTKEAKAEYCVYAVLKRPREN